MGPKRITLNQLLFQMWQDYCQLNPAAAEIHRLFVNHGETVNNDHIALRTFNHPKLGLAALAKVFLQMDYVERDEYRFKEKKLYARYYQHPDPKFPKVFISELELEKVSAFTRKVLVECAEQVSPTTIESAELPVAGRRWKMTKSVYQQLAKESEYASWVAAFGFRPNHFTVDVNSLKRFANLEEVNKFVEANGHRLNTSGGAIKGTPAEFLEQSSTMAKEILVHFDDGKLLIPGCYYEFAKRYATPNGHIYQGFVATSADKIFESTNRVAA